MPDVSVELDLQPLVARAQAGDEDAFGEVVKAHYPKVYAVIYRMVQNADDAKELTQIAWVKAWQRLASFEGQSKFTTWMYRLAVNTATDDSGVNSSLPWSAPKIMRSSVRSSKPGIPMVFSIRVRS